jgi:two-component system, OmpR family, phosphate regulon sensor histidine kinase PhoR
MVGSPPLFGGLGAYGRLHQLYALLRKRTEATPCFTKILRTGAMTDQAKGFLKPLLTLILSVIALAASLFLYIHWYIEASTGLRSLMDRFEITPEHALALDTWVVILVTSVLCSLILLGIFTIFVYNQKTLQLYRLQHNFINNFTHELKTPVTSIKLYLQTLTKYELPRNDQLKYIGYMLTDVERLSDNINRILNLAKIESKSHGGEFIQTDLVRMARNFFDINKHLFKKADIRIEAPNDRPILYRVNQSLFDMLLMNLATNSLKYNVSETPQILVRFESTPGAVCMSFRDNGIGLEKKEIKKIFKKFYQSGRADDMTAKGTGLGLYLVQNIARLHKGRIVASSEGRHTGASFTLVLPVRRRHLSTEST